MYRHAFYVNKKNIWNIGEIKSVQMDRSRNSDSKRLLKSKIRHLEQILGKSCHLTFSGASYLVQKVQGHLLNDGF